MDQDMVTISREELDKLRLKSEIADDALVQLDLGLRDIKEGRVSEF